MSLLRQLVSFGLAGLLTAWILLGAPAPSLDESTAVEAQPEPFTARLQPVTERAVPVESVPAPAETPAQPQESESPPEPEPEADANQGAPAPELGSRDGDEDSELREIAAAESQEAEPQDAEPQDAEPQDEVSEGEVPEEAEPSPAEASSPARASAAELAADSELKELARRELSGEEVALGFSTVLVSSPEDQLRIARAFGERVVLIPKAALGNDPEARSFELSFGGSREPRIVAVDGRPDLTQSRQYRDLFAYDFQRLDPKLRELRRRVIRRDEVFLFAALIPASEWAVVIGRRREACVASGVDPEEVDQFTLRYVRDSRGGFDIVVDEMTLTDGSKIRPPAPPAR